MWIPKELWFDKTLSPIQKMFLLEIDSLDNKGGCYASNAHFSELFGVTKGRCTQIIKGLEARKLVTIQLIREGKQIKKRIVRVVNKLTRGSENIKSPYLINAQGNTTSKAIVKTFARFDEWWNVYAKKADRKKCLAVWKRRNLDSQADMLIADAISRHANDRKWRDGYQSNPLTYLNGDKWEDEVENEINETAARSTRHQKPQDILLGVIRGGLSS